MNCSICKKKIEETFLKKAVGTCVKDAKGRKHMVCFECQRRLSNDKKQMLAEMKAPVA